MVQVANGVLITSDEATIVYILMLDERVAAPHRAVLKQLDKRRLFVKAEKVAFIQQKLRERLAETTYDEDQLVEEVA